jgi:hypothetical protein
MGLEEFSAGFQHGWPHQVSKACSLRSKAYSQFAHDATLEAQSKKATGLTVAF